jgi:protein phosphatase
MMAVQMDCHGMTDIGRKRSTNEDQFLIADLSKSLRVHQTSLGLDHQTRLFSASQGHLLVVADGMGGCAAGERASTLAIDSMVSYVLDTLQWFFRLSQDNEEDFQEDLKAVLVHCQERMANEMAAIPKREGMGSTLTMAYIIWPRMYVVHVGDSRCYLARSGEISQITRDHTVAEMYVEQGAMSAEDAKSSKWSHVLWNFLGGDTEELSPEVHRATLRQGDAVLLCTDGLTKYLPNEQLVEQIRRGETSADICQQLVSDANSKGGSDNITVILARFQGNHDELEYKEARADREDSSHRETSPDTAATVPLAGADA